MRDDLAILETEAPDPGTSCLDTLSTADLVNALHAANYTIAEVVAAALPQITAVVDIIQHRLLGGGRLLYVGAGTSGRLGVLDASECPPTFGTPAEMVQGIIAGGPAALTTSIEGAEDDLAAGARDVLERNISASDVVVGIAASGRTPYVIGALDAATAHGAYTVALVNVSESLLSHHAAITIAVVTGPETLAGSTRLKAGTAQKMVLNILTTAAMVRLGKVYGNLMVDVRATNSKLRDRAIRIVMSACETDRQMAESALAEADWQAKTAIVMVKCSLSAAEAKDRLLHAEGWVGRALDTSQ